MKNAICMSIDTVCSSFLTALKTACAFIEAGYHNNVMICVNSNWVTRCMDVTKDYSSLGDGSGALILRRSSKRSLLGVKEECRTEFSSVICMNSPIVTKRNEYFQFGKTGDSKEFFVSTAANVAKELMVNCGVFPNSIDWFICHQSGIRLMNSWRQQLEIDAQKHIHCFEELGNMSASNAIINFALGVASGKIKRGDKVLFFSPAAGVHNIALLWQY